MKAMGWNVAAGMVARWFDNPAYTFKEKKEEVRKAHPQDSTSISLKWARKFGKTDKKYNELISEIVYSKDTLIKVIKPVCEAKIMQDFRQSLQKRPIPVGFSTQIDLGNLQEFHRKWQFTYNTLSFFETAGSYTKLNELVAILGGFALYAAIGNVFVTCSRHLEYDNSKGLKRWCYEPTVSLTHIYVYLMDKFEFTDTSEDMKSQYLGHWNKHGVIITYKGGFSEMDRMHFHLFRSHFDDKPITERVWSQDLPVSVNGERKVYTSEAVYWPVFNSTFNRWRNKHGRGQDYMVFSMPELIKLKKPIEWKMDKVYGEWEGINENNL
ncbi:MAG: DUF6402 family protein [Betaproteobacteria bacterium]|nr:DUF6402 family protein [Betaproteobacteria bacterium]